MFIVEAKWSLNIQYINSKLSAVNLTLNFYVLAFIEPISQESYGVHWLSILAVLLHPLFLTLSNKYIIFIKGPNNLLYWQQIHLHISLSHHSPIVMESIRLDDQIFTKKISLTDNIRASKTSIILNLHLPIEHNKKSWIFKTVKLHVIKFKNMLWNELRNFTSPFGFFLKGCSLRKVGM